MKGPPSGGWAYFLSLRPTFASSEVVLVGGASKLEVELDTEAITDVVTAVLAAGAATDATVVVTAGTTLATAEAAGVVTAATVAGVEATVVVTADVTGAVTAATDAGAEAGPETDDGSGTTDDVTVAPELVEAAVVAPVIEVATGVEAIELVRVETAEVTAPTTGVEAGRLSVWLPKLTVAAWPPLATPTVASEPVAWVGEATLTPTKDAPVVPPEAIVVPPALALRTDVPPSVAPTGWPVLSAPTLATPPLAGVDDRTETPTAEPPWAAPPTIGCPAAVTCAAEPSDAVAALTVGRSPDC
jgi:hypothetical protein